MKLSNRHVRATLPLLFLLFSTHIQTQQTTTYSANTLFNMATNYKQQGDTQSALECYQKAIVVDPQHLEAHFFLANEYFTQGNYFKAIKLYQNALVFHPNSVATMFNYALALDATQKRDEAITILHNAVQIQPNHARARKLLGRFAKEAGNTDVALEQYNAVTKLEPNSFEAYFELGNLYRKKASVNNAQDNFVRAIAQYEKALEIDPYHLHAHFNCAFCYNKLGQLDACAELYERIMEFSPECLDAQYNLAHVLRYLGRTDQAAHHYEQVLREWYNNPHAHYGYAESLLREGNLKDGFAEFEWRLKRGNDTRNFFEKLWDGFTTLDGKTVLIRAEFGLGDTIQFIRFTKTLKERGATVIAEVQNPLKTILASCPYIDKIIVVGETLPYFDLQIPVMSLPHKLECTAEELLDVSPYLGADPALTQEWGTKLAHDKNIKIGICWDCSAYYDSFRSPLSQKTLHLSVFESLAQLPNVSLYSLQFGDAQNQIHEVNFTVHEFGPDFDNTHGRFMDTAALMKNLDLVLTVDTSVAHLAGALGVPVWVVLPSVADWRWMKDRDDCPWYPTMRLFRQEEYGNWKSVFENVKTALHERTQKRSGTIKTPSPSVQQKTDIVTAEISIGELIDKITILQLKNKYIKNEAKLKNVRKELAVLCHTLDTKVPKSAKLDELTEKLYNINQELWDIEDDCRDKERNKEFDDEFIQITRSVYITNDKRCAVKRQINELLGSNLVEEKSYAAY